MLISSTPFFFLMMLSYRRSEPPLYYFVAPSRHHTTMGRKLSKGGKPVNTGNEASTTAPKEKVASKTKEKWMSSTVSGG